MECLSMDEKMRLASGSESCACTQKVFLDDSKVCCLLSQCPFRL